MGDELVDGRRDVSGIGRGGGVAGEHRGGGHQRGCRVGRIGSGRLNDGSETLHRRQTRAPGDASIGSGAGGAGSALATPVTLPNSSVTDEPIATAAVANIVLVDMTSLREWL